MKKLLTFAFAVFFINQTANASSMAGAMYSRSDEEANARASQRLEQNQDPTSTWELLYRLKNGLGSQIAEDLITSDPTERVKNIDLWRELEVGDYNKYRTRLLAHYDYQLNLYPEDLNGDHYMQGVTYGERREYINTIIAAINRDLPPR